MTVDLYAPTLYTNRELSWLQFNARVVAQAERADLPLFERLKFVAIAASNLDEFYMIRVAALRNQITGKMLDPSGDRRRPVQVLAEIGAETLESSLAIAQLLANDLLPRLREAGVAFPDEAELDEEQRAAVRAYYEREVHPCLTPLAVDPLHPFPHLRNRSLNVALRIEAKRRADDDPAVLEQPEGTLLALVQVPGVLPRFVPVRRDRRVHHYMTLERIIAMHASDLFPGHRILEARPFRVTRTADLEFVEDEAENLLTTIQNELRRRDRGDAVRLELVEGTSDELAELLRAALEIEHEHVHRHHSFLAPNDFLKVYATVDRPDLKDPPFLPALTPYLRYTRDIFRSIAERDVLLHHPYESFSHVVDFLNAAADDPRVVAIKQTLYRTSGDSPIVRALVRAAQNGKQVTALVELKARFDEAANIAWARALEKAGVHVVYGLIGLKTHSKLLLVIRRESQELKRYLHVSTGNYNPTTARLYTDLSLLTAREDLTSDAMVLFNVLTGYGELPELQQLVVAPFNMRQHLMNLISREIEHAQAGRPARIVAKMNSLVDPGIIRHLYRASRAGVSIDLIVRGTCCLKPGIPEVSENIRVRALIGRFLEHARIYCVANGGQEEVFLSSADWMPRNLNRRVEISVPVLDPALRERIKTEILGTELLDQLGSWRLDPAGHYHEVRPPEGSAPIRAQQLFMGLARERAVKQQPAVRQELSARAPEAASSPATRWPDGQWPQRRAESGRSGEGADP